MLLHIILHMHIFILGALGTRHNDVLASLMSNLEEAHLVHVQMGMRFES